MRGTRGPSNASEFPTRKQILCGVECLGRELLPVRRPYLLEECLLRRIRKSDRQLKVGAATTRMEPAVVWCRQVLYEECTLLGVH